MSSMRIPFWSWHYCPHKCVLLKLTFCSGFLFLQAVLPGFLNTCKAQSSKILSSLWVRPPMVETGSSQTSSHNGVFLWMWQDLHWGTSSKSCLLLPPLLSSPTSPSSSKLIIIYSLRKNNIYIWKQKAVTEVNGWTHKESSYQLGLDWAWIFVFEQASTAISYISIPYLTAL